MKTSLPHIIVALLLWACANQSTPDGGPKDEEPPLLINSIPKHNGLNFRGTALLLEFSEPIRLKNPREEIIIVPATGKKTIYRVTRNTLLIEPELPWLENTTYSIQLREGIQDITEGNPAQNVSLAFSTGNVIDSLTLAGTVSDAFSEKSPEDMTVALYTSDTFDIQRHTPIYFTKADKNGKYQLRNLKPDRYYVYAFHDKNKNLKAESKTERTGFLTEPIHLLRDTSRIDLQTALADARTLKIINVRRNGVVNRIRFNKPVSTYTLKNYPYIHTFGDNQSEVTLFFPAFTTDSVRVTLTATDSVQNKIDTAIWLATRSQTITEPFRLTVDNASLNLETSELIYTAAITKPVREIYLDSVYLRIDSTRRIQIPKTGLQLDTVFKRLTYRGLIKIPDSTKITQKWQLVFGRGSIRSVTGDTLKRVTKGLTYFDQESTGTLIIDPIITDSKSYLIQILNSSNVVVREYRNPKKLIITYLPPETFKIRAIIDDNGNGRWDAGNIYQKRKHEQIIYFRTSEGKYETPVRANWEVGPYKFVF